MNPIQRVLVPIYECRDTYPAFDHAMWFGKTFGSRLLVAAAIRKRQFMDSGVPSPIGAGGPFVDTAKLSKFRDALTEVAEGLVSSAKERGLDAQLVVTEGVFPEDVIALTRQSDLLIESELHRHTLIERWWDKADLYADACCPTLVAHGGALSLSSALIVYNGTKQASKALRWVTMLAKNGAIDTVAAVAIPRKRDEQHRSTLEVTAFVGRTVCRYKRGRQQEGMASTRWSRSRRRCAPGLWPCPRMPSRDRFVYGSTGLHPRP